MNIYEAWVHAKEAEKSAIEARRLIEDELIRELALGETEGTKTVKRDGFVVKVTQRYNRKIDADALQEIAIEHGIDNLLGDLFRWKPEIDARAWKATDESLTKPLLNAITTTPGRPSFNITKIGD